MQDFTFVCKKTYYYDNHPLVIYIKPNYGMSWLN